MKRRTVLRSVLVTPAALFAQEPAQLPPALKPAPTETPTIPTVNADSFSQPGIHVFKPEQISALRRLGELIAPASKDTPGAQDAKAAEFLDFLIGQSAADLLALYRNGLDMLNNQSQHVYKKRFSELTVVEASPLLAPLREPWTYNEPAALLPRFLRAAKDDLLRATFTSREYISVVSQRRRNAGGSGQYWFPVD